MRSFPLAILVVLMVASGTVSGFLIGRSQVVPHAGQGSTREVLDAYDQEVGFSRDQRAKIERILQENHERFVTARARIEPELAAIRSDVRSQMRAILAEDQRSRFDAYCAKRDRERGERNR